jgi:hypothetical protein
MSMSPALYTAKHHKHPTSNRQWAQTDAVWAPGNVSFNLLFFQLTSSFFFFLGSNVVTMRHHHDGPHVYLLCAHPRRCKLLLAGQHQRNAVELNEQKQAQMMLVVVWVPARFFEQSLLFTNEIFSLSFIRLFTTSHKAQTNPMPYATAASICSQGGNGDTTASALPASPAQAFMTPRHPACEPLLVGGRC